VAGLALEFSSGSGTNALQAVPKEKPEEAPKKPEEAGCPEEATQVFRKGRDRGSAPMTKRPAWLNRLDL